MYRITVDIHNLNFKLPGICFVRYFLNKECDYSISYRPKQRNSRTMCLIASVCSHLFLSFN